MFRRKLIWLAGMILVVGVFATARGQERQDPKLLIDSQRKAMLKLAKMDGVWRGPAWTISPSGEKHDITQTERIGPFLDGSIKVIEGRGYDADGTVGFNAFGTILFDQSTGAYTLHSYAQGRVGDFELKLNNDGYQWEIPAGAIKIRYTAVIKDGAWREVGDQIAAGKEPVRFFEMNLKRVGDTDWPAAGAISPKWASARRGLERKGAKKGNASEDRADARSWRTYVPSQPRSHETFQLLRKTSKASWMACASGRPRKGRRRAL